MTKVLKLACLGSLHVDLGDKSLVLVSAKGQALLAYLAVTGRVQSRQFLAGLLWGELPEADARRNLRGVVMKLRQDLGDFFEISHQSICFVKDCDHWLDVDRFHWLRQQNDVASLEQAVALYRGDFLADLFVRQAPMFEAWLFQQREALRQNVIEVCGKLVILLDEQQRYDEGIDYARRWLALDPANEECHRLMMILLAKQGQRSAALMQYESLVKVLAEMGVEPTTETAVLLEQIRNNALYSRPAPKTGIAKPVSASLPPFLAGPPITHPAGFFGREKEIKRIINLVRYLPMQNAAIIGPRRSGKTSLLHYLKHASADLLRSQPHNWIFVDFQDARLGVRSQLLSFLLAQMQLPQPEPCDLEHFMDVVSDDLHTPTVILMDEIGVALQRYPELDEEFWESLRSLATNQVGGKLAFILAGAEAPEKLAQQSGMGSPFFNIFGYAATLGPLRDAEALSLINSAPTPFAEEDVAWILEESGRWPILLQILCRERLLSLEEAASGEQWRQEAIEQISPFAYLKDSVV
ncbi:MAG: hypothetical protein CSA11_04895 [Chloroflexi bacterium]|nr:MAG: hypothetical protein CSB13_01590 [Chloroflexota bacterium]PIE81334.1 MAG: hypothetical protein CSA11_04895 [Chloroflexota bacterium]